MTAPVSRPARARSASSARQAVLAGVVAAGVLGSSLSLVAPAAAAAAAAPAAAPSAPSASSSADASPAARRTTPHLPFDMPSTASLRTRSKLVFAHYMPSLPLSIDNKPTSQDYYKVHYLSPSGENGKHRATAGFLRDRPLTPKPSTRASWRVDNMRTEIRQAVAAGIDGFTLNIMQLPGDPDEHNATNVRRMLRAAELEPGFKIALMPDMTTAVGNRSVNQLATQMARLARYDSAYRLSDGRLVIAPYRAEKKSPAFWRAFAARMASVHGIRVALVATFDDERRSAQAFRGVAWMMSNWGSRTPRWNPPTKPGKDGPVGRAKAVRALGAKWMQPVSLQDSRHLAGIWWEARNTQNLRDTWRIARDSGSRWVQVVTWNDYSENSHLAPSKRHRQTFLDLNAYYATWYKTGKKPRIVRDTIYLTHRTQKHAAKPRIAKDRLQRNGGGSAPWDKVEALVFLRKAATVKITVGGVTRSCKAPRGVSRCLVPLRAGKVSAKVVRAGKTVESVKSPYRVVSRPRVQDLSYVGVSSGRQ